MAQNTWHILREGDTLTLARRLPVRWDVACRTELPRAGRLRVAQQIRQDLWRALRGQRGFSPCIELRDMGRHLNVRAGGQVDGPHVRGHTEGVIAQVLSDERARRRWMACAQHRQNPDQGPRLGQSA